MNCSRVKGFARRQVEDGRHLAAGDVETEVDFVFLGEAIADAAAAGGEEIV